MKAPVEGRKHVLVLFLITFTPMYPLIFGPGRQNELPEDKTAEILLVWLRDVSSPLKLITD